MTEDLVEENSQGKSLGQLGNEALWFAGHTAIAILTLVAVVGLIAVSHPGQDASTPKILGTALAFFVPMLVGFVIARVKHNEIGGYVWISGLLISAAVWVWVIDLPTGPGLCESCTLIERIWRTCFSVNNGSGLMGGDGLLIGTWVPLSLFGYAFGTKLGLNNS